MWLLENKGGKLPKSVPDIAIIVGCTQTAVRSYMYRKRAEIKKRLEDLPDLRILQLPLIDIQGKTHLSSEFLRYSFKVDYWCSVLLEACTRE
ncbi:hypothetical protein, partial [Salmonella enterica]|uniref:hypothetical protein n=1 Tax=Salmonella enterica TaxID=28901 RepID=UPI0035248CB8